MNVLVNSSSTIAGFGLGSKAEIQHTITSEDVRRFTEITGDDNPLHVDHSFAAKTSLKGVVAHGMLSASFISTIIGKRIPGPGALWVSQTLDFLLPVRVGDRLAIVAEVVGVHESTRMLTLKTEIRNQHDQLVLAGERKVKMVESGAIRSSPDTARLENPVVIVTGGSRGIGARTAAVLAAQGFAVIVNYREDAESAGRVVAEIEKREERAIAVRADVTRPSDVRELVDAAVGRFGGLSAVVNAASSPMVYKPFADLSLTDLSRQMEIQYYAAFDLIKTALPFLEKAHNAAVVNISSIVADNVPPPRSMAFAAAKAALTSMTKSLAVEYGPHGIRFNIVAPGMTDTDMIALTPEKAKMLVRMQTPLRKLADPSEVAEGIAFLLSAKASHITGETLRICGGGVML
jgi:3-oxoacyl-[acyl-carrier protein] reductase